MTADEARTQDGRWDRQQNSRSEIARVLANNAVLDALNEVAEQPEHRCAQCYVAQYGMKSDVMCKNEWWSEWDRRYGRPKVA